MEEYKKYIKLREKYYCFIWLCYSVVAVCCFFPLLIILIPTTTTTGTPTACFRLALFKILIFSFLLFNKSTVVFLFLYLYYFFNTQKKNTEHNDYKCLFILPKTLSATVFISQEISISFYYIDCCCCCCSFFWLFSTQFKHT